MLISTFAINLMIYLNSRPYMGVCLYTIIAVPFSDMFNIQDFMNYHFLKCHDIHNTTSKFESTDCTNEVS
jgi:hypothetical protein